MYILGISCYYHDSAACILKDGNVIAAVEEERFSRKKYDDGFPKMAMKNDTVYFAWTDIGETLNVKTGYLKLR